MTFDTLDTLDTLITEARSLYTLLSFLTFVGITLWACGARRKEAFAEAANLPFADEPQDAARAVNDGVRHG